MAVQRKALAMAVTAAVTADEGKGDGIVSCILYFVGLFAAFVVGSASSLNTNTFRCIFCEHVDRCCSIGCYRRLFTSLSPL